jgi:hypothetical protein
MRPHQPGSDTLPDAQAVLVAVHRRMSGERRLLLACTMSDEARFLTLAGLRWAHPEASEEQIAQMERRARLGAALADAAWPDGRDAR